MSQSPNLRSSRSPSPGHRLDSSLRKSPSGKKSEPNFAKWTLGMTSFATMALGPLIIYLGYQAYIMGVEILVAEKVLMGMGTLVCFLGAMALLCLILNYTNWLLYYFYAALIVIIFISVFALGASMMQDDIRTWVDKNWDKVRTKAAGYDMEEFKLYIGSEIQSLAAFSLTVDLLLITGCITVTRLIGPSIKRSLLSVLNLFLVVLGSALFVISLYSRWHSSYTKLPTWTNYIFSLVGVLMMGLASLGYYASVRNRRVLITIYTIVLSVVALFVLMAGCGFIMTSSTVIAKLSDDWPEISAELGKSGYEIDKQEFGQQLKMNFKFAGLFGVVSFCVLMLALLGALVMIRDLKIRDRDRAWMS